MKKSVLNSMILSAIFDRYNMGYHKNGISIIKENESFKLEVTPDAEEEYKSLMSIVTSNRATKIKTFLTSYGYGECIQSSDKLPVNIFTDMQDGVILSNHNSFKIGNTLNINLDKIGIDINEIDKIVKKAYEASQLGFIIDNNKLYNMILADIEQGSYCYVIYL